MADYSAAPPANSLLHLVLGGKTATLSMYFCSFCPSLFPRPLHKM